MTAYADRQWLLPGALRDTVANFSLPIGYQSNLRGAADLLEDLLRETRVCQDCGLHGGSHDPDCEGRSMDPATGRLG